MIRIRWMVIIGIAVGLLAFAVGQIVSRTTVAAPRTEPVSRSDEAREKEFVQFCEAAQLFHDVRGRSHACDQCVDDGDARFIHEVKAGHSAAGCAVDHGDVCNLPNGHQNCTCWAKSMMADTVDCQAQAIDTAIQYRPCISICRVEVPR